MNVIEVKPPMGSSVGLIPERKESANLKIGQQALPKLKEKKEQGTGRHRRDHPRATGQYQTD